jgi:DNA-binding GntR family transcriptional regulator
MSLGDVIKLVHIQKRNIKFIYENLKGKILRGDISSDDRLQEDNLTKEYETSRTPIGEPLRRLEDENVIEKLHYGGYKVKELTMKDIDEIFGIRCILESYAASLATQRITEDDIEKMEDILRKSQEALEKEIKKSRYRNKGESAFAVKAVLTAFG